MRFNHLLPTVHASVVNHQMSAPGDSQVKRFAQVSRLGQQMSLEGDKIEGRGVPVWAGLGVGVHAQRGSQGSLYGQVQGTIGNT